MKIWIILANTLGPCLLTMIVSMNAIAEPYLAQRAGLKCSACHTNITGGGKRTVGGNGFAASYAAKLHSSTFNPQLNDAVSIGGNFRFSGNYQLFPDAEVPSGTVIDPPPENFEDGNSFDVTNGTLYLEFAVADSLSFYLDQQVAPEGGRTREAFALSKGLFGDTSYLKVGKFFLPFGLRLQDDQAFTRQVTGFNFDNSDIGVELGYEPGAWSFSAALTNGTQGSGENNQEKKVSLHGAYIESWYRLGLSFSNNTAPGEIKETLYGAYVGVNIGKFNVLGEIDFISTEMGSQAEVNKTVSFLSLNYPVSNSLNLKFAYEFFEPSDDIDEDEQTRISIVGEKFTSQFMQIRFGLRDHTGIPQNAFDNRNTLFGELHFYF